VPFPLAPDVTAFEVQVVEAIHIQRFEAVKVTYKGGVFDAVLSQTQTPPFSTAFKGQQ